MGVNRIVKSAYRSYHVQKLFSSTYRYLGTLCEFRYYLARKILYSFAYSKLIVRDKDFKFVIHESLT